MPGSVGRGGSDPRLAEHDRMRRVVVQFVVPGVALVVAVGLTACGSAKTVTQTVTSAASTTSTTTSSAPTSTTSSATSTSTATAPVIPHCEPAMLSLSFLGQQGATGHGELGFALRNIRATSCRTSGFPGVLFLDKAGGPLPTIPTRTTVDLFGAAPVERLIVAPGASVSFRLGVTHGLRSPVGCTTAYGLQVIPPNDYASLRTTIPGGAAECRTATVSPVRPGDSAYP